jgi:ATP-binding protein involved in chromosome partitioning
VGKTLVASSVIQALVAKGKRVGAVDADFSNPNLGRMLKISGDITIDESKKMHPVVSGATSFFSIETFAKDRGVFMTGDEYSEIIRDAVANGIWDVDYMVVDLPAAISNEFRSVLQLFENDYLGSIVVSQPSHLQSTERVIKLHQINGVPILGLVENMVGFTCGKCMTNYPLFGESGVDALASQYGLKVLGKIPVSMEIQNEVRAGEPVTIPDSGVTAAVADSILAAKPQELGFIQELKAKVKQVSRDTTLKLMRDSVRIIRSEVNIPALMTKNHFPGGQIIALVVMDEKWEKPITRENFKITKNGMLGFVKDVADQEVTVWLYIKGVALGWSLIGEKKFPDGKRVSYDLMDAWLNGDARVYGDTSVVKAISFYRDVWDEAKVKVAARLGPVIEALV